MALFGRDNSFYELLEKQSEAAIRAAKVLHQLSKEIENSVSLISQIEQIETEADGITHELSNKIDSTFVTPLDKEDLSNLSSGLDDITDMIEALAARLSIYKLSELRPDFEPLVYKLLLVTQATHEAIVALRDLKNRQSMQSAFIRIHELENESDISFRKALTDLFDDTTLEPIYVMKWKEVYDRVEAAVDSCEDVANIVESVVMKYA